MKKLRLAIIIFICAAICSSCDHDQHYGLTHQAFDAYIINETDQLIVLYTASDSLALPPQQKTFLANTVVEYGGVVGVQFISWEDCPLGKDPIIKQLLYQGKIVEDIKQNFLRHVGSYDIQEIRKDKFEQVYRLTDMKFEYYILATSED